MEKAVLGRPVLPLMCFSADQEAQMVGKGTLQ